MSDNTTLAMLETFMASHTCTIRDYSVITDVSLSELFETDLLCIHSLTECNLERFQADSLLLLNQAEQQHYPRVRFAYTDAGIFTLASLIKTKRAIRIYVKLIELLVNRLQGKAYEIATSYPGDK